MEQLLQDAALSYQQGSLNVDFFSSFISSEGEKHLTHQEAKHLLNFLVSKCGLITKEHLVTPLLTSDAKYALETLWFFLSQDEEFVAQMEKLSISQVAKRMKLERHLLEGPVHHSRVALQLVFFLSNNYVKFANWRLYVRPEAHSLVTKGLKTLLQTPMLQSTPSLPLRPVSPKIEPVTSPDIVVVEMEPHLPPAESSVYELDVSEVMKMLSVRDLDWGLEPEDVALRKETYGKNELPKPKPPSMLSIFLNQFKDFMIVTLLVVMIIEIALQKWAPFALLVAVVGFEVFMGFFQELKANKALQVLQNFQVPSTLVIRGGEQIQMAASDIVPGDIVCLNEGDQVPCDLRLFEVANFQVIESVLTGESVAVAKHTRAIPDRNAVIGDRKNMAFMTTTVAGGRAKGIAVATGKATEMGKISKALSKKESTATLLQKKIAKLGKILVLCALLSCVVVVGINLLYTSIRRTLNWTTGEEALELGVSLGVSAIPEGLVAVVAVTMAMGVKHMAKRNALAKRLAVVEALGSVTTICSDKTGTLTEGKMKPCEIYAGGSVLLFSTQAKPPTMQNSDGIIIESLLEMDTPEMQYAFMCGCLCNNSTALWDTASEQWNTTGDPTEAAIMIACEISKCSKTYWKQQGWEFVAEAAFDSDRKCMSVLYCNHSPQMVRVSNGMQNPSEESWSSVLFMKGAPESVVRKCLWLMESGGKRVQLTPEKVTELDLVALSMAKRGMRVLAMCFRPLTVEGWRGSGGKLEEFENDMVFLSFIGLIDPPRSDVKAAIKCCREAGICTRMITGDHALTAAEIAFQLGIIENPQDEHLIIRGADIEGIENLDQLEPFPRVFARVSPDHKMRIVEALQKRNEICVMTGDGVNDAPAIKKADIGIAMGDGTDLTKQTADLILLDNSFSTIAEAIREGRHAFDSIKKFIIFLLACNISEVFAALFAVLFDIPVPFTPIMILCINLCESFPALALSFDPQEKDVMTRKPRAPSSPILSAKSWFLLLFQALSIGVLTDLIYGINLVLWKETEPIPLADTEIGDSLVMVSGSSSSTIVVGTEEDQWPGLKSARATALLSIMLLHVAHSFLSRSVRNTLFNWRLFHNLWLDAACILYAVIVCFFIFIPGVKSFFDLQLPSPIDYPVMLGACVVHILLVEFFKFVVRFKHKVTRARANLVKSETV